MSVTAQTPYKKYTAAPGATLFPADFKLLLASDLEVKVNSAVVTSGFTVSGVGAASADVTFGTPMVGGEIVELQRKVPKTRATDYQQLGDYQASQVNFDFDRIVQMLQDSQFLNDLAVLLPVGDAGAPMTLPDLATRASKFLAFDAGGAPIAAAGAAGSPVSVYMAAVLLAASASAARTALGAQASLGFTPAASGANTDITSLGMLTAGGLPDNSVLTADIANAQVTPAKLSQPFTAGATVATTSGTSIDFTGIPSWVKRVTVLVNGVSTNGTSNCMFQLGAGSITSSGYLGTAATNATYGAFTTGLGMGSSTAAGTVLHGVATFTLTGANTWAYSFNGAYTNAPGMAQGAGTIALSGVLDRIRMTTVTGADAFDAGAISILYE